MVCTQRKSVICFGVGAFLIVIGIIVFFCFPLIFKHFLQKEIQLVNGTTGFKVWSDIPFPITQKLYFFNITNGEDFMRRKVKPKLQEVGPYAFISRWKKKAIKWHPNGTVSYKEVKTFVFNRNESVGSQDDMIVTLNAPMLIAANFLKNYDLPLKLAASFLFGVAGERLIIKKSIKQLAFDGYRDIIILLSPILQKDIPFKNGLFAWLYGQNGTDDGLYAVYTGETDLARLNILDNWNGKKLLPFWSGKSCNMLNGTNAELGPPLATSQKTYSFFQSLFCRSITLSNTGDVTHSGVKSYRFMPTEKTFANASDEPSNACFTSQYKLRSGVQDISKCQFGAPVMVSFPHFYLADPWYVNMVNGLKPDPSKHSFHLDVEPTSGLSIDAAVRFQINLYLQRIEGIAQLQGLPKVVFPVFWIEIVFELNREWADLIHRKVLLPGFIVYGCLYAIIAIGCLCVFGAIAVMLYIRRQRSIKVTNGETTPLLGNNNDKHL